MGGGYLHEVPPAKILIIMAKGNLFQGMARGKVGDVVFSRSNGEQVTRVRNRKPRNPKTSAQLAQRAIMATVMKAYAAGKAIFDHSFEGYAVPSGCQRKFMSENAKALRAALAADSNAAVSTANATALVVGPGTMLPVANTYKVSEGSLVQSFFSSAFIGDASIISISTPARDGDETIGAYMARTGLVVGDIYTFICFAMGGDTENAQFVVNGDTDQGGVQLHGQFGFLRLTVKAPADPTAAATAARFTDVFTFDESSTIVGSDMLTSEIDGYTTQIDAVLPFYGDDVPVTFAIIRSRENNGARSTETMQWARTSHAYGINYKYLLAAWQQGAVQLGDSELILEGGNF